MSENFSFLKSNRFWALVLGAAALYLQKKGILAEAEMIFVETILGGFVGIRTADRISEKLGGK